MFFDVRRCYEYIKKKKLLKAMIHPCIVKRRNRKQFRLWVGVKVSFGSQCLERVKRHNCGIDGYRNGVPVLRSLEVVRIDDMENSFDLHL